jgi:hypothetical protein
VPGLFSTPYYSAQVEKVKLRNAPPFAQAEAAPAHAKSLKRSQERKSCEFMGISFHAISSCYLLEVRQITGHH